tara:strand:+ start:363 stop:569 length:207 start_codon:yes stop_codon:yes gene_type:complete
MYKIVIVDESEDGSWGNFIAECSDLVKYGYVPVGSVQVIGGAIMQSFYDPVHEAERRLDARELAPLYR